MVVGRVKAPAENGPAKASFSQCVEWHGVTPADVERLLSAAALLVARSGWTQKEGAKNAAGLRVPATSPEAALFSLNGAIMRAQADLGLKWTHAVAAGAVVRETVHMDALAFNEERGRQKHEVEDALYRAVWRARSAYGKAA